MRQRHKVAVVGLGAFGVLHAQTMLGLGDVEVVALVDRDLSCVQVLAAQWKVTHVFSSLEQLIEARIADAVIIATRTDTHVPLAELAVRAGLDVLLEKPAGRNSVELARLEEVCFASGKAVMVDHICLFHSLVSPLVERVIREGFRAAHFVRHRPAETARKFPDECPLSLLMVHDFYVAVQLVQGEEPVEWHISEARNSAGQTDMTWVLLRWKDGRVATFHSHMTLPPDGPDEGWDALEIFGQDYHTRIDTNPAPWTWNRDGAGRPVTLEISTVMGRPSGMLAEVHRRFFAVLEGAPVPAGCRLQDARQIQCWVERLGQTENKIRAQRRPLTSYDE